MVTLLRPSRLRPSVSVFSGRQGFCRYYVTRKIISGCRLPVINARLCTAGGGSIKEFAHAR